jgi:hypothetical protein
VGEPMNVFSYWEGPRPEYIQVCLDSMARVLGDDFHLVTPETVNQWVPPGTLHPAWRGLPQPALRADCLRAALLAVHGGWWWDADTVAIDSPLSLHKRHRNAEALYTTWTKAPVRVLNGYIYIRHGSKLATKWLAGVNDSLHRDRHIEWCSLGEKLITDMMLSEPKAVRFSRGIVLPIDIDESVSQFFDPADWRLSVCSHGLSSHCSPPCFGLNHSWFWFHRRADILLPRAQWPKSPLLIHQLLDWAATLNECHANP